MKKHKIQQVIERGVKVLLQLVVIVFILLIVWGIYEQLPLKNRDIFGCFMLAIFLLGIGLLRERSQKIPKEIEYDRYFAYRDEKPIDPEIQELIDDIGEKEKRE